jgi:hypothetical protein
VAIRWGAAEIEGSGSCANKRRTGPRAPHAVSPGWTARLDSIVRFRSGLFFFFFPGLKNHPPVPARAQRPRLPTKLPSTVWMAHPLAGSPWLRQANLFIPIHTVWRLLPRACLRPLQAGTDSRSRAERRGCSCRTRRRGVVDMAFAARAAL